MRVSPSLLLVLSLSRLGFLVGDSPPHPCTNGEAAGTYDCNGIDMYANLQLDEEANKIWGWTDPSTSIEYVLLGGVSGTHIFDILDPANPIEIAFVPTSSHSSVWRDIKTYQDYAYIVSEAPNHGMQVVDLTQLRDINVTDPGLPVLIEPVFRYKGFGNCHEIEINVETGIAYCTGSRTCNGGLHMMNLLQNPSLPTFDGCFGDDGYFVSAKCVVYQGPDTEYHGQEDRVEYAGYVALSEDHSILIVNDLLDEFYVSRYPTTTHPIFSLANITSPELLETHYQHNTATDGDIYVQGSLAYSANFCGGVHVLQIEDDGVSDYGWFDTDPQCDSPGFCGTWSVYPYFESGVLAVASIQRGLFLLGLA